MKPLSVLVLLFFFGCAPCLAQDSSADDPVEISAETVPEPLDTQLEEPPAQAAAEPVSPGTETPDSPSGDAPFSLDIGFLSILAAAAAATAAWLNLRNTRQMNNQRHMHDAFRSYLTARLAMIPTLEAITDPAQRADQQHRNIAYMLYTMEELHGWTEAQRRGLWMERALARVGLSDAKITTLVTDWEHTIVTHVTGDIDAAIVEFEGYRECYGAAFRQFIAERSDTLNLPGAAALRAAMFPAGRAAQG